MGKLYKRKIAGLNKNEQEIFDLGVRLTKEFGKISRKARGQLIAEALEKLELLAERGRPTSLELTEFSGSREYLADDLQILSEGWSSMRPDHPAHRFLRSLTVKYKGKKVFDAIVEEFGPDGLRAHKNKNVKRHNILSLLRQGWKESVAARVKQRKEGLKKIESLFAELRKKR